MTVRTYLNQNLRPLLPAGWVVYDHDRTLTKISKVTALYVHRAIEPAPEQGWFLNTVSLVVCDPTQSEGKADVHLDDVMVDLIPALAAVGGIQFLRAEKGTRDTFPAWDVQLQIKTTA